MDKFILFHYFIYLFIYLFIYFLFFYFFFLQLQQTSLDETPKQMVAEEESAKVFLEEILQEVCRDVENTPQLQHKEQIGAGEGSLHRSAVPTNGQNFL